MEDDLKELKARIKENSHLVTDEPPENETKTLTNEELDFTKKVFGSESPNSIAQFRLRIKHFNRFAFNALNLKFAQKIVARQDAKKYSNKAPETIKQIEDLVVKEIKDGRQEQDFERFKIERKDDEMPVDDDAVRDHKHIDQKHQKKDQRTYHTILPTFLKVGPWSFFERTIHTISSRKPREEKGLFLRSERFDNNPLKQVDGIDIATIDTLKFLGKVIIPHGIQKTLVLLMMDSDPETTGGADRLWYRAKQQFWGISYDDVVNYVRNSEPHQIHRQVSKTITSRPILLKAPGIMGSVDLVDLRKHKSPQDPFEWVLTYVDLFSKWTAARATKEKSGPEVARAMFEILCSIPEHLRPTILQSDNGKEFTSNDFRQALGMFKRHAVKKRIAKLQRKPLDQRTDVDKRKLEELEAQLQTLVGKEECDVKDPTSSYERRLEALGKDPELDKIDGIRHVFSTSYNPNAQASIERFNRTLKSMIYKFSTRERVGPQRNEEQFKNMSWASKLQKFVDNHNSSPNDTTKLTPDQVMAAKDGDPIFTQVFEKLRHNAMKTISRSHKPLQTFAKSLAWINQHENKLKQVTVIQNEQANELFDDPKNGTHQTKQQIMDAIEPKMASKYYYHRKKIREYEETEINAGDVVRLAVVTDKEVRKNVFRKGALGYWSRSLYVVTSQQWLAKGTPVDKEEAKQLGLEKTYRVRKLNIAFDKVHSSRQNLPEFKVLDDLAKQNAIVIGAIPTHDELLRIVKLKKVRQPQPEGDQKKDDEKQKQQKAEEDAKQNESKNKDDQILMPTEKHLFWRFQLQKIDPERLIVDNRGAKDYRPPREEPEQPPQVSVDELLTDATRIFRMRDLTSAIEAIGRWNFKYGRRENSEFKDEKLTERKDELDAIRKIALMNRGEILEFRGHELKVDLAQDNFPQFVAQLRQPPNKRRKRRPNPRYNN